jgi:hypothetical protein
MVAQALSVRKEPDAVRLAPSSREIERFKNGRTSIKREEGAWRTASGSFLMLNACATILEPLDPIVEHPLW